MRAIYALTIVFAYYAAGEVVSSYTKAKIPSSVARSIIILTTFWTGLVPTSVFEDAGYSSFAMLMVGIMITGMGNTIDFTEAKRQIKTVVVAILGMSAGVALILTLGSVIIERSTAFAGAPIYAGGQAALLLIMTEMADKGEAGAQVVVICTLCHYIQQYSCAGHDPPCYAQREKEGRCGVAPPQRPGLSIYIPSIFQANSKIRYNSVHVKTRELL